jgi:multidrug efflux pump subunit AcrA (membrane-fusion protein)
MRIKMLAVVSAAGVAIAAAMSSFAQGQGGAPAGGEYFVVQQARGATSVSLGGTVIPYKEVTLSAQLPGRIKYLAGREGDAFEKDALLVSLDTRELTAQRRAAEADLRNADTALRTAGVQYSRELYAPRSRKDVGGMGMPNLFDQMFTAPFEDMSGRYDTDAERWSDIYTQGAQITKARNSIMAAQSRIQAIDAKLRDSESVAPFDGVIMKKFIEVGDTVQPGQPLLEFADITYLQVMVDVPARLMPGIQDGMMLQSVLDVRDTRVPARVAQIYPMADPQRHTVTVKFDLPVGSPAAPGMYARVKVPDLNAPARDLPVIPVSAIRYNGSLPGVYVQGQDGRPELRLIRVGEEVEPGYTAVLSGLVPGERVLRNPPVGVSSGWAPGTGAPQSAPPDR